MSHDQKKLGNHCTRFSLVRRTAYQFACLQLTLALLFQGESQNAPFTEDEARSSDQLREIIKYLRRERDVTSGKFEVSQAENQRLEAQRTCLRTQIDQLTKEVAEEREKNQVRTSLMRLKVH